MGGVWDDIDFSSTATTKVKAHRTAEEAEAQGDVGHFLGNQEVDLMAKKGALMGYPAEEEVQRFCKTQDNRKKFLHAVGKVLGQWQHLQKGKDNKKQVRRKEGPKHDLVWFPPTRTWHCGTCSANFRSRAAVDRSRCKSGRRTLTQVAEEAEEVGHRMFVVPYEVQPMFLLACLECGKYAQARVEGLSEQCLGKPLGSLGGNSGRRRVINWIVNKRTHPFHKVPLGKAVRWKHAGPLEELNLEQEVAPVVVGVDVLPDRGIGGFDDPDDLGPNEWEEVEPWGNGPPLDGPVWDDPFEEAQWVPP